MRIAIVSDIHGNFDALAALPREYDQLWVLGDLVNYGPEPKAVIDFVREHASIVLRGNHDHAVGRHEDPRCSPPLQAFGGGGDNGLHGTSAFCRRKAFFSRSADVR